MSGGLEMEKLLKNDLQVLSTSLIWTKHNRRDKTNIQMDPYREKLELSIHEVIQGESKIIFIPRRLRYMG